jgi:type II secretory pathway component PulF
VFTSLTLAGRASGDAAVAERIQAAVLHIQKGGTLEAALAQTRLFTPEFLLAVASGEVSGRLQEALEQQARLERRPSCTGWRCRCNSLR